MKQSQLFTKTRKEAPKDEVSKNAQLLIRAGFIQKQMAGVYAFMPLGLRVMNKIIGIIREEMNLLGGQEVSMTALQDKKVWEKTGRWDDQVLDVWFKTKLKNESELGLGTTHEEPMTLMMKDFIRSYRDLPSYPYQFQTKFRNETRAKSGIMRCREFLMKDLYSFSRNESQHIEFYEKIQKAYIEIFNKVGIGEKTYLTFASGGSFSQFSHEFQTESDAGEDIIYVTKNKRDNKFIAINKEIFTDDSLKDMGLAKDDFREVKSIEVGNIFTLGTKFSNAFELTYVDETGKPAPVIMGSYGIGPGRLMGTVVETLSDEAGIVWPESIAPFKIHLISLGKEGSEAEKDAVALYEELSAKGTEVLFDDRDTRAGEKFADSDLIGIPYRIVVSDKTLASGGYELKVRKTGEVSLISKAELLKRFIS